MSRNKGSVKAQRKRSDHERLELFIRKFEELRSTQLAKKGFRVQHRVHYSPGSIESNLTQPDESDVREYLSPQFRILLFLKGPKVEAFPVRGQRGGRMKGKGKDGLPPKE